MDSSIEATRLQVLQDTLQQISLQTTGDCCVICLGALTDQCEAQPCKHKNFDYICLTTWLLQEQTSCPLCKSDVVEVRYEMSTDGKQGKVRKIPRLLQRSSSRRSRGNDGDSYFRQWDRALRHSEDEAIQRRHFIYRHNLYSLHVGSNRRQPPELRYQELTPELFRNDPELISRTRRWISRELQVFEFLYTGDDMLQQGDGGFVNRRRKLSKAGYLLEYIIAILKVIDIKCSTGQAEDLIPEFLGRKYTRLFLHELRAWLRSPFKWLSAWDRAVQYDSPSFDSPLISPSLGAQSDASPPRHPDRRNRRPAVS